VGKNEKTLEGPEPGTKKKQDIQIKREGNRCRNLTTNGVLGTGEKVGPSMGVSTNGGRVVFPEGKGEGTSREEGPLKGRRVGHSYGQCVTKTQGGTGERKVNQRIQEVNVMHLRKA